MARPAKPITLKIHPELAEWLDDLEIDELTQLRRNLEADGCLDPIKAWDGYIVDGHQRYGLCTELGIPFDVKEMEFDSILEVKKWMSDHQAGRRNWNEQQRVYQVAKTLKLEKPENKANIASDTVNIDDSSQVGKLSTVSQAAKDHAVDRGLLSRAVKVIDRGSEELNQAVAAGNISLRSAARIAEKPKSIQKRIVKQKSPAKSVAAQPLIDAKDELGQPIPGHLVAVFAARVTIDEALNHLTGISKLTNPLTGNAKDNIKGLPGGEYLERQRLRKAIEELRAVISFARPYALCPRHTDKSRCMVCGGRGWVVEHGFKTAGIK